MTARPYVSVSLEASVFGNMTAARAVREFVKMYLAPLASFGCLRGPLGRLWTRFVSFGVPVEFLWMSIGIRLGKLGPSLTPSGYLWHVFVLLRPDFAAVWLLFGAPLGSRWPSFGVLLAVLARLGQLLSNLQIALRIEPQNVQHSL